MHDMTALKDSLEKELGKIAMDESPLRHLELIHKLTDVIKNICKIEKLGENEYSQRYSRRGSYDGESFDDGNSYARRRRDSMGRYTRDYSGRRYSRDEAKDSMIQEIEDLMRDAKTEQERMALMRCKTALQES